MSGINSTTRTGAVSPESIACRDGDAAPIVGGTMGQDEEAYVPSVIKRSYKWIDGQPVLYDERIPVIRGERYRDLAVLALNLPYQGKPDSADPSYRVVEPEFKGLTNVEVMFIRMARDAAAGDREAFEKLNDRINGKPRVNVASVQANMSYAEYLQTMCSDDDVDAPTARSGMGNRKTVTSLPRMSDSDEDLDDYLQ